jgi:hypothetical protein
MNKSLKHEKISLVRRACVLAVPATLLQAHIRSANAQASVEVARAMEVKGQVLATAPGAQLRPLQNESPIYGGDRVVTARNASVTVVFADQTELYLGDRTIINIDSYQFAGLAGQAAAEETMQMSIFRGVVRAVTGLLARRRPQAVRFSTPSATIGIRGTHFVAEVEDEEVTVVLLAQEDQTAPNAVQVSNPYGSVEVAQPEYGTVVPDADSPPSPVQRMRTQTMNRILRNVQTTRRVIVPRVPVR